MRSTKDSQSIDDLIKPDNELRSLPLYDLKLRTQSAEANIVRYLVQLTNNSANPLSCTDGVGGGIFTNSESIKSNFYFKCYGIRAVSIMPSVVHITLSSLITLPRKNIYLVCSIYLYKQNSSYITISTYQVHLRDKNATTRH